MPVVLSEEQINRLIDKLNNATDRKDLSRFRVVGRDRYGEVLGEMNMTGDGSVITLMRDQLKWIERGKPRNEMGVPNYFEDINSPSMLNLLKAYNNYEDRMKRKTAMKRQQTALKKLTGVEKTIKMLEIHIDNATSINSIKEILPRLKQLKEIYDADTEPTSINNKISKVIDKYNKKFTLLK